MRILFFGDYSNLHACLAAELRRRNHEVTVISDGGRYMDTRKDILLDRQPGKIGTVKYLFDFLSVLPKIHGYDVVQFINPHFLTLRPNKLKYFFDIIRRNNKSVFLTLAGNDWHFVNACINTDIFKFSEFRVGNTPTEFEQQTHHAQKWLAIGMREYAEYFYSHIDGAMSILPEYDMAARLVLGEKLVFTNIPIDLEALSYKPLDFSQKIKLFIGMRGGMEIQKGTAMLYEMCKNIEHKYPELCQTECVRNLSLKKYLKRMSDSHIVLDQYYSYSPGTNGFQAMALGKIAATGGQPEFYSYIGENSRPIVPLSPLQSLSNWENYFIDLIHDQERMQQMSQQGRQIVSTHNDVRVVTDKFEQHWNKILESKI